MLQRRGARRLLRRCQALRSELMIRSREHSMQHMGLDHSGLGAGMGSSKRPGSLFLIKRFIHERFITPIFLSKNPPWFNARGVGLGLAVGLLCPMGLQLPSVTLLRLGLKFNVVVALAFSFVSNPFTFVPLYYGYYLFGSLLLGRPASISEDHFAAMIASVGGGGYFMDSASGFLGLGREILARWLVSAVVFAGVFSVLGYVTTYWVEVKRLARKQQTGESNPGLDD